MMKRKGSAQWQGSVKEGKGSVSTPSGVLDHTQYSFSSRFAEGKGTNPEELIAAAHAGCFSMSLSSQLGNAGFTADSIDTTATVTVEKLEDGFSFTQIHLEVLARIPKIDDATFKKAAQAAKEGCPVSKVLKATITMDARLVEIA
jgi:osmotically inducible protein OsmC